MFSRNMSALMMAAGLVFAGAASAATTAPVGNGSDYPAYPASHSTLTRADVQAQVSEAQRNGAMAVIGDRLYFTATDGVAGFEMWVTDGTEAGTTMVKDLNPSGYSNPRNFVNANGTLYFTTPNPIRDELWKCEEEFPWEIFLPAFIHRD